MEKKRLVKKIRELSLLNNLNKAFFLSNDLSEILDSILRKLGIFLQAERGMLLFLGEEQYSSTFTISYNFSSNSLKRILDECKENFISSFPGKLEKLLLKKSINEEQVIFLPLCSKHILYGIPLCHNSCQVD